MATTCLGINQSGGPCGGYLPKGSTWCLWHDPARESEREEWRRRGGENRSNRARARRQLADAVLTINDLDALLCRALVQVAGGKMEPGVGTSMATIAKTITTIRSTGELERRIEELERQAATRKGWTG